MKLTVVAVGDGASSIIRSYPDGPVMVVDCGTAGNGGVSAADTLNLELGSDAQRVDTVVVSHFDSDHWWGLKQLPALWGYNHPRGRVELRYPAFLPGAAGDTQKAFLAVQTLKFRSPISDVLDLAGAWDRSGVQVVKCPTARGTSFSGAGGSWSAHWPPVDNSPFHAATRRAIERLAKVVGEISSDVPAFSAALGEVERLWGETENIGQENPSDLTGHELDAELRRTLGDKGVKALAGRLGKFNNVLSLVHTGHGMANFGDCEGAGLSALIRLEKDARTLPKSFPVIIAPHHGTHAPIAVTTQNDFPKATSALVSQNGERRYNQGNHPRQRAFKAMVAGNRAAIVDTYNPSLKPSLRGPHLQFQL